jgi:hypothetical protein
MSDFVHFWIDCIIRGTTWGNGVFAAVEIICAILWVFYRKKHDDDASKSEREDKVRNFGKWCFITVVVFSTVIVAPYLKFHEKENEATSKKEIADTLSSSNSFLNGQIDGDKTVIRTLKDEIADKKRDAETANLNSKTDVNEARRERDAALQRLDFFEANPEKLSEIYSNIFANTPTNFQQFDLSYQKFTNAFQNLNSKKPFFKLTINHRYIKTNDVVVLPVSRSLFIQVFNLGSEIAKSLTVEFSAALDVTNFISDNSQWHLQPVLTQFTPEGIEDVKGVNTWLTKSRDDLPITERFDAAFFSISTNYNLPTLPARIRVYSEDTSIPQDFIITFDFQQ